VVDEEENLVGIVTSTDMVMLLLDQYRTKINWQNEIKAI
jgi:CBS domain-containing protein